MCAGIIFFCVVLFGLSAFQAGTVLGDVHRSWTVQHLQVWGGDFHWWTLLTSGFVHLNLSHLSVNMIMLALIGPFLERHLGHLRFVVAYLVGLVGSAGVVAVMDSSPTVGASGALFALMVLLLRVHEEPRAPLALLGANLVYTFVGDGVSLWGHLGGLLWGIVLLACGLGKTSACYPRA